MQTVWIVVAIAVAVVLIVLVLAIGSGRIGRVSGQARVKHGDTEFEGSGEIGESKLGRAPKSGVNVKNNKLKGKRQKIAVETGNANVEDNLIDGEDQEILVYDASDNKSLRFEDKDKS